MSGELPQGRCRVAEIPQLARRKATKEMRPAECGSLRIVANERVKLTFFLFEWIQRTAFGILRETLNWHLLR